MKIINSIKGMALICAMSLVSCSDSNEIPEDMPSNIQGVEQVGDNEYIVSVGTSVSWNVSRNISNGVFDDQYEPDKLYVHSTGQSNKVLTFNLDENKSFSFRIKTNDDGSFVLGGDATQVLDPQEDNCAEYSKGEQIYFSSWPSDTWENESYDEDGGQIGSTDFIPTMTLQERTNSGNWREIYRSEETYTSDALLTLGQSRLMMTRVVSGYMNVVVFTDLQGDNATVDEDKWNSIITDPRGAIDQWSIILYLGEFPVTYDLKNFANGSTMAYYASNKNEFKTFTNTHFTQAGVPGYAPSYVGFGLQTDYQFLCTPVTRMFDPLVAYIVVKNKTLGSSCHMIEQFGEESSSSTQAYCYATPNNIEQLVTIYDLRDLAAGYGLQYVNENGSVVEATTVGVNPQSRTSNSEFVNFELKPRKVIRVKL